jgi:excisionase family DNA binding protein
VKDYLTVKEAAKYLKRHPATVRSLIKKRKLKAQKLAGKFGIYLIARADLLEYMMSKVIEESGK